MKATDWIGRRFGKLVIVAMLGYCKNPSQRRYLCKCDCGNTKELASTMFYGKATCCGCSRVNKRVKHGLRNSSEYRTWQAMWTRVTNPNHEKFAIYGAMGVTICERWKDFTNFYADMGPKPTPQHSIDRYPDPSGNYEPSNCRWATMSQQRRNQRPHKRSVKVVTAGIAGVT